MKREEKNRVPHPLEDGAKMLADLKINTDPDGSWTGVPLDEDEEPVQDVDDL
ncbi:MAG: hypothetical protein IKC32_07515 [Clostridia bacterium]|nr:hypothetical protein [Clostridia bacterium]